MVVSRPDVGISNGQRSSADAQKLFRKNKVPGSRHRGEKLLFLQTE